jgi:hypothetical protein
MAFSPPGGHRSSHFIEDVEAGRFPIYRETNVGTYSSKKTKWCAEDERKIRTQYISSMKEGQMLCYNFKALQLH